MITIAKYYLKKKKAVSVFSKVSVVSVQRKMQRFWLS